VPELPRQPGAEAALTNGDLGSADRDQLRRAYADAWRKHLAAMPLTPLEAMLADVIELHPEYQGLLRDAAAAVAFEPTMQGGGNPFLHLALHMAVREQVSVDRPPGVRELRRRLEARSGDLHGAEHALMEALLDTLWEAQRTGGAADETQYMKRATAQLSAAW
jgi:hypothetical protein